LPNRFSCEEIRKNGNRRGRRAELRRFLDNARAPVNAFRHI
jgi:hypothetical protein